MNAQNNSLLLYIAGYHIKIVFLPKKLLKYCKQLIRSINTTYQPYLSEQKPQKIDFTIEIYITHFEKAFTLKEKSTYSGSDSFLFFFSIHNHIIKSFYHISKTQFTFLLLKALEYLLQKDKGFILHASSSIVENELIIFTGKKGAGKSTSIRLLKNKFKPFTDDAILIKNKKGNYYGYQLPFKEKIIIRNRQPKGYPLKQVCFLRKSTKYSIIKLNQKDKITTGMIKQIWASQSSKKEFLQNLFHFTNTFSEIYILNFGLKKNKIIEIFERKSV